MALTMAMMLAAVTVTGCTASNQKAQAAQTEAVETEDVQEENMEKKLTEAMESQVFNKTGEGSDTGKDETVYVISDAAGTAQQVIVSEWLKNSEGRDTIEDITDLKNIENVKGNETWTEGTDGKITWQADGNDIYYQGTSDKELPVRVKLTYYLDGKKINDHFYTGQQVPISLGYFDFPEKLTVKVNALKSDEQVYIEKWPELTNGKACSLNDVSVTEEYR